MVTVIVFELDHVPVSARCTGCTYQIARCYGDALLLGDMKLPPRIQEAMQMQVEAERKKRATVLESEGV